MVEGGILVQCEDEEVVGRAKEVFASFVGGKVNARHLKVIYRKSSFSFLAAGQGVRVRDEGE